MTRGRDLVEEKCSVSWRQRQEGEIWLKKSVVYLGGKKLRTELSLNGDEDKVVELDPMWLGEHAASLSL